MYPLHGNPEKFPGPEVSIDGYGGHIVRVKAVQLSLGIRCLPPMNRVYVSPIPEYILSIDVLQGLWLHTSAGVSPAGVSGKSHSVGTY